MPKAPAAATFAETPTKCAPSPAPGSERASQLRAAVALASVSCVVNVFEMTTNAVDAGSSGASARAIASGSTLDTNDTRTGGASVPARASQTMRGPRSEPPMPMLTTSVIGLPVAPRRRPWRIASAIARMRRCASRIDGITSCPSTRTGVSSC